MSINRFAVAILAAFVVESTVSAQCAYDIQVLPPPAGYAYAIVAGLAANGTVVGWRRLSSGSLQETGFTWHPSTGYVTLPPPPGGAQYWHAFRISDDGLIAGHADVPGISDQYLQLVTWDANGTPSLYPPKSPPLGYGIYGAVGSSRVIGTIEAGPNGSFPQPFIIEDGKELPLPPGLVGYFSAGFNASNSRGWAGGYRGTFVRGVGSSLEPVVWDGEGDVTVLPPLGADFPHPQVRALSDDARVVVVGEKFIAQSTKPYRSFLWWGGAYTPIGSHEGTDWQFVTSINDSGQAVGSRGTLSQVGPGIGFLWQEGAVYDLATLAPVPPQVKLSGAVEVRNDGRILVGAKFGPTGIPVGAILTPLTSEEDVNLDCSIDARDLSIVLGAWGDVLPSTPLRADVDHDGVVGAFDVAAVLAAWTPRE